MDATKFYEDIALKYDSGAGASEGESTPHSKAWNTQGGADQGQGASMGRAMTFTEAMFTGYRDGVKRAEVVNAIKNFVANVLKLGTTDIGSLFLTSIGARMPFIVNRETQLLNLMESASGPTLMIDDWMYRIRERRQGATRASRMNPEAALSTTPHQTVYSEKNNVLAFWGDPVSVTFIARAQAQSQNTGVDLLRAEMDAELLALRKARNFDYWNGVLQANFTPPNITQLQGLLNRIITNTENAGGLDISEALLESAIGKVADAIGYMQLVLFTDRKQVGSVRTIELNRYSGNNPVAFSQYNAELAARFSRFKVQEDRIFEPNIGPVVPVVHDRDLPDNTSVLMCIEDAYIPRPVYFSIGGEIGPWMFVRPVYDANETVFVMDGGTMDDPGEETKVLITNNL